MSQAFVFVAGSWTDDTYPYAINDPASLYSKIVKVNRIKEGGVFSLSYDRCLKAKFVKEDDNTFRTAIGERDKNAGAPSVQRIRVEIRITGKEKTTKKNMVRTIQ